MDTTATVMALRTIRKGIDDLIDAITDEEETPGVMPRADRELELAAEFDRPEGQGLTQKEASLACRKHGFAPQTVGAWARGGYIETRLDLRYLAPHGYAWLEREGVKTQYGPESA